MPGPAVPGIGRATLNGGAGNNLFMFNKDTDNGGNTVIEDFGRSTGNVIGLYNYGLNQNSLNTLFSNSYNDYNGNTVLNLDNHQVTFVGVSINNLHSQQFSVS